MSILSDIGKAAGVVAEVQPRLKKLEEATKDFEAIFFKNLLSSMRKGVPGGSLDGSTFGGDMYRDMLDGELAKAASQSGSLGIGKLLYKQLAPLAIAEAQAKARVEKLDTKA